MNKQLLMSTAIGLILGTAAFAQSPGSTTTNSPSIQTQTSPSPSASSVPSAQTQPSNSTTSQSAPSSSSSSSQAQTSPSGSSPSQAQTSPSGNSPSQAQTTPPASTQPGGSSQPSQAQTNNPPAINNQAQQAPNSNANTTAQQPNPSSNTAQSVSPGANAQANINDQQRTRVTQSIARLNVQPLNNVNFAVSVGTVVPRDVRLQSLPTDVVEVVPQYRGYDFFVVRDEIVIVEPSTYRIVSVLPRGGSTAAAPAPSRSRVSVTEKDREIVRKHVRSRPVERRTTGSASARLEIRRGEQLPEAVEVEELPETVYRDAPALREYRYIHRENRTYLVDPGERRVIEEVD